MAATVYVRDNCLVQPLPDSWSVQTNEKSWEAKMAATTRTTISNTFR